MAEVKGNKKRLCLNRFLFDQKGTKKKFEDPYGAVVGLGIVAAMCNNNNNISSDSTKAAAVILISPRSTTSKPIPIFKNKKMMRSVEEMEMCEEYTCVISHVGSKLIKKREYFDGLFIGNSNYNETAEFRTADFLSSCFLCNKQLQGLDIFMYRGDKAFCSAECRCKQIAMDEHKEKCCGSGTMKSHSDFSSSPCSAQMQFFTGVAVA